MGLCWGRLLGCVVVDLPCLMTLQIRIVKGWMKAAPRILGAEGGWRRESSCHGMILNLWKKEAVRKFRHINERLTPPPAAITLPFLRPPKSVSSFSFDDGEENMLRDIFVDGLTPLAPFFLSIRSFCLLRHNSWLELVLQRAYWHKLRGDNGEQVLCPSQQSAC